MSRAFRTLFLPFAFISSIAFSNAQDGGGDGKKNKDRDPTTVSLNDGGQAALKKFSVAQGLRVDLWAEEPLIANGPLWWRLIGGGLRCRTFAKTWTGFSIRWPCEVSKIASRFCTRPWRRI
jgi:hypothetical protein